MKETSIPERKGVIHVIATTDKNKIHVYTSKGRQRLSHTTVDFRLENFTTTTAAYSGDKKAIKCRDNTSFNTRY